MAGLKTLIGLSFVLAIGFILIILSSVLYKNVFPILVVATYIVAPLPNIICNYCASPDDFIDSSSGSAGAIVDFGRFLTGFLVVMGIGMCDSFVRCERGCSREVTARADVEGRDWHMKRSAARSMIRD
jgi:hypothetical protein